MYRFTQPVNMLFINLSITFQQIQNVSTHPNTPSITPYPTTCLFASKITHHIDKYSVKNIKKITHKKSLLTKYLSSTESSDCRSPRHDGKNWFIPETSLSGPSEPENRNTLNVNPGTSNQQEEEKSRSRGEKFLEDNLDDISVTVPDTTPSSGEKFPEDKSGTKSTSEGTIPYLGTEVDPIQSFSSGSPSSDGHTTQVISGGTTEVISVTDSSTTTDEEYTYVPVTSTPVKKNAPAFLDKNGTGDSSNLPSTIFGSPETTSNNMQGYGGDSSSDISESELDNILDKNLEAVKSHNHSSQNMYKNRKRQFFDSMLKGKDYLHYLLHYLTQ